MMFKMKNILLICKLSLLFALISITPVYAGENLGIFSDLASDTTRFAVGLRNFAYVISGFGIIMFTFLAISGKINFKHLGYIILCLFILSAVGTVIYYITDDGARSVVAIDFEGGSGFGKKYTNAGHGKLAGNSSL